MSIIARSIASIGYSQGPRSVSSVGYLANQQDGRSGYWRLFFTQMQEEALKKSEEKSEVKKSYPKVVESADGTAIVKTKVKPKKIKTPRVETESVQAPLITPLPPFKRSDVQPDYGLVCVDITRQIELLIYQHSQIAVQYFATVNAANDESDIELLLLVA